jgi:alginate O-acetyltransferase complex protein AlgF
MIRTLRFRPRRAAGLLCAAIVGSVALSGTALAQEIARLYASQPPAGSSFVRVVNPDAHAVSVEFAGARDTLDPAHRVVTDYRVVDAAAGVVVKVNGRALAPLKVKPGSFNTVVLEKGAPMLIADDTDGRDDLKAELRFYNVAPGCDATLAVENGPEVFAHVPQDESRKRVINPVQARVVGRCGAAGTTATSAVPLPALKSGDRASVFLLGGGAMRLVTQLDATAPYSGTH